MNVVKRKGLVQIAGFRAQVPLAHETALRQQRAGTL